MKRAIGFMNKSQAIVQNTFLGGVSATISTPALLATKLGISVANISNFEVVGSDIKCFITGSYVIPGYCFYQDTNITYYRDTDGLVTDLLDNCFRETTKIKELIFKGVLTLTGGYTDRNSGINKVFLENCTSISGFYTDYYALPKIFYIPRVTTLGTTVGDNGVFYNASSSVGCIIYAHPSLATNNGGNPDGDLQYAISKGATVRYVTNFTAPNPITNLSVGNVYNTAIQVNFTAPSSTNAIDYYEGYANGVYKGVVTNGGYITGLSPSTSYNIEVKPVDIFYNKSTSNTVTQSTTNTSGGTVDIVRDRIEADGGFMANEGIIQEQYNNLVSNSLQSNLLFWHSYKGGIKKDGSNLVEKMYSFTNANTDVIQTTTANKPLYSATGIVFDTTDILEKTFSTAITNKTFSIVWKVKAIPTNYTPGFFMTSWDGFILHSASGGGIYAGITVANRFALGAGSFLNNTDATYTFTYNSVSKIAKLYRNTTEIGSKTMVDPVNFTSLNFQGAQTFYDLKMFDKDLSLTEITNII